MVFGASLSESNMSIHWGVCYHRHPLLIRNENMRLTFDIEEEDHKVLCKFIPHGLRKYAYKALIKGFVKELKKDPGPTMEALLGQRIRAADLVKKGE